MFSTLVFVLLSHGCIDGFHRGFIEVRLCSRPFAQDGFIGNKFTLKLGCFPYRVLFFPEIFFAINSLLGRRCGKPEHQGMDWLLQNRYGFEPNRVVVD